jgi:hypothetical protein
LTQRTRSARIARIARLTRARLRRNSSSVLENPARDHALSVRAPSTCGEVGRAGSWGSHRSSLYSYHHARIRPPRSTEPYTSSELPSADGIRLLKMIPGSRGDPILCSLCVTRLAQLDSYAALSYCWGKPVFEHAVLCDGTEIRVTENLYLALQRLRLSHADRLVWIDALCTDQSNIRERGSDYVYSLLGIAEMAQV